ncbi:unnamed protein product, partial [Onchocerca ochengi]
AESTTSVSETIERPLSNHSGKERSEIDDQHYESLIAKSDENFDDQPIKNDNDMSKFEYTKVQQMKESKTITTTEEIKSEDNDYTEGWDTTIMDDGDEYSYEDQPTDSSDTVSTGSPVPVWLEESDDYHTVTKEGHPQRIYLNKKRTNQMVTRLSKDKRMKNDEERWKNENDNFGSQESMTESEFVDDGWMISKRRRVITSDATVITNKPLQLAFFLIFSVMPLLRW